MKAAFETVKFKGNIPANIERHSGQINISLHWHKEPELLYLIDGALTLTVSEKQYLLESDDVFLINSQANHQISGNGLLLSVHLSEDYAKKFGFDITRTDFELIKGSSAEDEIRTLLWQLSKSPNKGDYPELLQYSIVTDIIRVLLSECGSEEKTPTLTSAQVSKRSIKVAMEYIEQHYQEPITLNEIADMLGLHPAYLSCDFKKVAGMEFREYLTQTRMKHALDALLKKGKSVEEAAKIGGFPSKRNFIDKCKRAYNQTPMQLIEQKTTNNISTDTREVTK